MLSRWPRSDAAHTPSECRFRFLTSSGCFASSGPYSTASTPRRTVRCRSSDSRAPTSWKRSTGGLPAPSLARPCFVSTTPTDSQSCSAESPIPRLSAIRPAFTAGSSPATGSSTSWHRCSRRWPRPLVECSAYLVGCFNGQSPRWPPRPTGLRRDGRLLAVPRSPDSPRTCLRASSAGQPPAT